MILRPADALDRAFERARQARRLALVPFVTGCFPDPDGCLSLMHALADAGADAIEMGVPFSDPLADGPTIQRTSQLALSGRGRFSNVLEVLEKFRNKRDTPVILMSYANPLVQDADAVGNAVRAGANGVLITDLPADELPDLWDRFRRAGVATVQLVAPTTDPSRLPAIAAAASGFLYVVARTGVTGKGAGYASNLESRIGSVRAVSELPLLIGFGVREPDHVKQVAGIADGVIVGTALLDDVLAGPTVDAGIARAAERCRALANSLGFPEHRSAS